MRTLGILLACGLAMVSCSAHSVPGDGGVEARVTDVTDVRIAADVTDVGTDLVEPIVPVTCRGPSIDANCDPAAHIDCFGGVNCISGAVYVSIVAPIPCCNEPSCVHAFTTDYTICSCDQPAFRCSSGTCPFPGSRYSLCPRNRGGPGTIRQSYFRALCAERSPQPGQSCAEDDDCRPAPVGGTPLRCDSGSHVCVVTVRPAVPACTGSTLTPVACAEDEDCPNGSSCVCPSNGTASCQVLADGGGMTPVMCVPTVFDAGAGD